MAPCFRDWWQGQLDQKRQADEAERIDSRKSSFIDGLLAQASLRRPNSSSTHSADSSFQIAVGKDFGLLKTSRMSAVDVFNMFSTRQQQQQYQKMLQQRQTLPIFPFRDEIISTIAANAVLFFVVVHVMQSGWYHNILAFILYFKVIRSSFLYYFLF
jgi:HrpA-like RNA helicase